MLYTKGELLPITFTHHDKARSVYGSRVGVCEVEEEVVDETVKAPSPITTSLSGEVEVEAKEEVTVTEITGTEEHDEIPEEISDAIVVTETSILDVPPEKSIDEVPKTGSSAADEVPQFHFNISTTGTPT
ncbi:MAG: hypothetical protein RR382_02945 [Tannerellaceae bacterium]